MNFRFVFLVVFIFFCVLGVVYGGNNTTLNHSLELNEGYDNYNQEINKQDNPIQLYSTGWNLWLLFCVIVMVLVILILDRRE